MADTIEQLDIKISASAERSTKAVSKLASVLQRLKSVAGGLSSTASSVGNGISRIANSFKSSSKETEKLSAELDKVDKKFQKLMDKQEKMEALGIKHDSRAWKSLQYDMVKTGKEWETLRDKLSASKQNNVSGIFKGLAVNLGNAFKAPLKGLQAFGKQLMRIARYRAIRALLQDMGKSFEYLYNYSKAFGTEYAGSMDRIATSTLYLRNSIAAMAAPLVQALAPAIDFLIDKIVTLINWLNHLFAILGGKATYTVAKKSATAWKEAAKGAGGAAAELKRTLLGFDEINRLADESGGGGGGGGGLDAADMFEEKAVSSLWQGLGKAIENALQDTFSRIAVIVAGAETALGAILLFTGHPAAGIALLMSGLSLGTATIGLNWEDMPDQIRRVVTNIEGALGLGAFAIGAILAFATSHKALGIGLMIGGASALGSAVALNWGSLTDDIQSTIFKIEGILGVALLAIGAIIAFATPKKALGIALMISGAVNMAAAVALNWNELPDKVKSIIGIIEGALGAAKLTVGAILAFATPHKALGIGLMISGVMSWATAIGLNWNGIQEKLLPIITALEGHIAVATLMLGVLMLLMQRWGLGLGLIALGAAGLAASSGVDFDAIGKKILPIISGIVSVLSKAFLLLGILAIIAGHWGIGLGLIAAGVIGLVTTSSANWSELRNVGLQAHNEVAAGWDSGGSVVLDVVTRVTQVVQTYTDTAGQMFSDPVGFLQETDKNTQQLGGVGGVLGRIWDGMNGGSGSSGSSTTGTSREFGGGSASAGSGIGRNTGNTTSSATSAIKTIKKKALGGIFSGGMWRNIPQFAGGGGLHGSIFWAGENGPEIVGHVGGRTEVLNKSQLASAMYAAVRSAMAPAAANYADTAMYLYSGGAAGKGGNSTLEEGIETMESMLALLRQQNAEFVQALENFRVECDGETLGRAAIRGINTYQQRTGRLAITL